MTLDGNNGAVWLNGGGERENDEAYQEDGGDWFSNQPHPQDLQMLQSHHHHQDFRFLGGFAFNPNDNLLIDSSSSCSPSQAFSLEPSFLAPPNNNKSCLLANPFDNAFEFGSDSGFLGQIQPPMGFGSLMQLGNREPEFLSAPLELEGFGTPASFVGNRAKVLKPLEVLASSGAQPTLFQKRAAMRQSSGMRMRRLSDDGEMDETGVDVSGLNYESDELNENGKATEIGGGGKGKKKGMPAKNLMAERRRRKKLNDRL